MKICQVTTSPLIVNFFLVPHLVSLARRHEVALAVTLPGEAPLRPLPGVEVIPVDIRRRIEPLRDARALAGLRALFGERRFDLVHSFGPKAGLLATAAGRLAGTPARLHTFTGQVWAARRGPMRALLRTADRLTARMATHVLADSASQRDFMVREGVVPPGRCEVLGTGSVSGVDLERFRPDERRRGALRAELGIAPQCTLIVYLGRITRDKGVLDLAEAYGALAGDTALLLVGPDEERLVEEARLRAVGRAGSLHHAGYTDAPERYLAAADLLCLPSYREGFGTVVIEAAAAGVPAVASRIYGVVDAVVDGETGLLFEPGDVGGLRERLARLVGDAALRLRLGRAARERAASHFDQRRLVEALGAYYERALA